MIREAAYVALFATGLLALVALLWWLSPDSAILGGILP